MHDGPKEAVERLHAVQTIDDLFKAIEGFLEQHYPDQFAVLVSTEILELLL